MILRPWGENMTQAAVKAAFLDLTPWKGEWINLKGEPIFFVCVAQG